MPENTTTELGPFETFQKDDNDDTDKLEIPSADDALEDNETNTDTNTDTDELAEKKREASSIETPNDDTPAIPDTPDMTDNNDSDDTDAQSEPDTDETDAGYTRKRMNIQRGDGPDQRGEVTVEVVRENNADAREIMRDVMPRATDLLMVLLDLSDDAPQTPRTVTSVPADDNGYVRIRMDVQRGDGPDQRGDTNTEEVGREPNAVFRTVADDMTEDVEMLTESLGL